MFFKTDLDEDKSPALSKAQIPGHLGSLWNPTFLLYPELWMERKMLHFLNQNLVKWGFSCSVKVLALFQVSAFPKLNSPGVIQVGGYLSSPRFQQHLSSWDLEWKGTKLWNKYQRSCPDPGLFAVKAHPEIFVDVQHGGDKGSNWLALRDPFCSIGFCLISKGILLGNVISLSFGGLNAIPGGAGLKGMSARGLENRARIKKWVNNERKLGEPLSPIKGKRQMKSDTLYANKSCQKCW